VLLGTVKSVAKEVVKVATPVFPIMELAEAMFGFAIY
jgi:hypothetical protein